MFLFERGVRLGEDVGIVDSYFIFFFFGLRKSICIKGMRFLIILNNGDSVLLFLVKNAIISKKLKGKKFRFYVS